MDLPIDLLDLQRPNYTARVVGYLDGRRVLGYHNPYAEREDDWWGYEWGWKRGVEDVPLSVLKQKLRGDNRTCE